MSGVLIAAASVGGQSQFLRDVKPGKYEAFYLKFSGDAAAAGQLTEAQFGTVELLQAGTPVVSVAFDNLHDINELVKGNLRTQNTLAGIHEFGCVIPRNYWFDDNIHQVNSGDQLQVQINYGATFTTVFTGADLAVQKLYGIVRETGEMAYNLRISQQQRIHTTGPFMEPLGYENVLAVYIVKATGNLDRVRALKDNAELANIFLGDPAGVATAQEDAFEYSDWDNSQEAATDAVLTAVTSRLCEIQYAKPGVFAEYLSDDSQIEFITSGATFTDTFVVLHADFTDNKLRQTKAENAAILQAKIARKQQKGRVRPIRVLEEMRV